jgi:ribonuclease Z
MKVNIIGTGEAFNENLTNSSVYIQDNKNILIDCGFNVAHAFWKKFESNNIDIIYISHFHADHFFGLPAIITRMIEEKRNKELIVIGQKNIEAIFMNILNLAYPNILSKKEFKISFFKHYEVNKYMDYEFYFARTNHSSLNYAIGIKNSKSCITISGDGAPTQELIKMYNDLKPNLIIQECFTEKKQSTTHCSLEEIDGFVSKLDFKANISLIHISRQEINKFKKSKYRVLKDNDIINI